MTYDYEKEKREAIQAGEYALQYLQKAGKELDSAKNWGIMDIIGGGFFATMLKRDKMDKARRYMEEAGYALKSFSKELADIDQMVKLNLDTGGFLSFADLFFDGLAVDWIVQNQINDARNQVAYAIRTVEDILNALRY